MQYIIDSADINAIRRCVEYFPVAGVTTNPTIISKEKADFKALIQEIREVIGPDKMLHIQATSDVAEDIVKEAVELKKIAGGDFYIKVPVSAEGLKAMHILKGMDIKITATAIFTQQQAMQIAGEFLNSSRIRMATSPKSPSNLKMVKKTVGEEYFICSDEMNHSFVIVSVDDAVGPVLAYSTENAFGTENMPENVKFYLKMLEGEVRYYRAHPNAVPSNPNMDDDTEKVLETAKQVYEARSRRISTSELNDALLPIVKEQNPPPAVKGKWIKIKYITQLPTAYPQFVFFCNLPQYVRDPYKRFVENRMRELWDFHGVPVKIYFRAK